METRQSTHPSPRQLAALALGRLAPEARDRLQAHVSACASCEAFLAQTPPETLRSLLQQSTSPRNSAEQPTSSAQRPRATNPALAMPPQPSDSAGEPSRQVPSPASTAADDSIPRELREQTKYRIVRLLGRGGMGSVYEVHHERMDRREALKVINPELVDNPQALLRFEQELKAVAKLDHPNIARAYDAESFGTLQAIVMEFVPGQTLHELLKKRGRLAVKDACRCVRQACLGLQHAHERGLVHRDLKPQNLMLTQDSGIVKILDFGLAKVVSENKAAQGLTKTNMTMGTYEYSAPEQAIDAASADIRADIYSLGCTIYYLISGVLPFDYNSDAKLLLAHQNEVPRPLGEVCPETPQELSDLVARMLAKSPADRPQTPGEVAKALLPFAKGEIASVSPLLYSGEGQGVRAAEPAIDPGLAKMIAEVQQSTRHPSPMAKRGGSPRPPAAWLDQLWHLCQSTIPPRFRTRAWPIAAGGAALAGILLFGVLIRMRTPEGTLIVEISDPAEATIQVLDAENKVLIQQKAGEEKVELSVVPGKGKLRVVKKGFELFTKEFSLVSGGRESIKVSLEPTPILNPQPPIPSPAPGATSPREVDLLKLVDPAKDIVSGNWRFSDGSLVCELPRRARIEIPYDPPEEYDYRIVFVSDGGDGGVDQICRGGGTQFDFVVGGWGNTVAGFHLIHGKKANDNPTTTKADHWLVARQRHVSVVKVRKDGVEGWFDDKRVVGYKTDWTDMSVPNNWLQRADSIGIGTNNVIRVESATIIEITGKGKNLRPPAEAEKTPENAGDSQSTIPPPADDNKTVPIGEWFSVPIKPEEIRENWSPREGGKLTYVNNALELQNGFVEYPICAKDMSIRARVKKGAGQSIGLGLRASYDRVNVGGKTGVDAATYYNAWFNGGGWFGIGKRVGGRFSNIIDVHSPRNFNDFFEFEFRVEGDKLTALADGEVVLQCQDQSNRAAGHAAISVYAGSGQFAKVEILITNNESSVSDDRPANRKAGRDQAAAPPREIDLLNLVDPAKDAVLGNWSFKDGSLVCEPLHYARIEIPYDPPEEYDYRIVFVSDSGGSDPVQICRSGGRQFGFVVGAWGNTTAGFGLIDGKKASNNPTTTKADHWLVAGQRHVSVVKVRKDGVEGWFDDKRVVGYKTDWRDMSLPVEIPLSRPDTIGIATFAELRVESATIIEITGKGKNLRPPAAPAATPPKEVIYEFNSRDAVLKDFDLYGGWDVVSNELLLTGPTKSNATSKAVFSFPLSIEYQMYFLPDRPYDLFPGFAGIHLGYASYANTRTDVKLGEKWTRLPHTRALPNHLYSIVFDIDHERTLAIRIDGTVILRQHLNENVSLKGPVFLGPVLGHVACKRIIVRTT